MTLTEQVAKNIITRLLKGEDYRIEIVALINAEFLQFAMDFFEQIVHAKLRNKDVVGWYKKEFLHSGLDADDIATNSGLNKKTITNMFNSATKQIVISASNEHYDILYDSIASLVEQQPDVDLTLNIKFQGVSVELNINESLIVINTLAVKRAALRGGLWSTAGKRVEKPLMQTLCLLFGVPTANYAMHLKSKKDKKEADELHFEREIDFYLLGEGKPNKCEVKLMGKGNPESADAVIARDSQIFVADKLSDTNKIQLDSLKVQWVELRSEQGFRKFETVLQQLNIPHLPLAENWQSQLETILNQVFLQTKAK